MIFDRTIEDVNNAIKIRAEKVQNGVELSQEDIATLERGTITLNTLNRIEEKQNALKSELNGIGYWNTPILNKHWTKNDIFDETDFQRIVNNLEILKKSFFVYSTTPSTPTAKYYFENINAAEKILSDIELMISDVANHYKTCGTFECGE